jgi:hypothetical protein
MKFPKFHLDFLDDSLFCSKCGMSPRASKDHVASFTRTMMTPSKEISTGMSLENVVLTALAKNQQMEN